MKKIIRFSILVLALLINLTACNSNDESMLSTSLTNDQNPQVVLSYDQYVDVIKSAKEKLNFSTIPMKLTESTLESPTIVIVSGDMSFDKKEYLSLKNDFEDSTQYFLTYEDTTNGYELIIGWIYTEVDQGNNLLYFKPDVEGNTGDFNSILSFKNILIHLQLTHTQSSIPSSEDFVRENEAVLKDVVRFLETEV
ncbi:hypothetical protein [Paenibacillus tarimensis]|uniref:hypothetical protein n=1 Tax=Paenibacillus tarimensis TaxID=416012 RepID=UPI001F1D30DF|nr:hypothetical protein [Paenibacillus tarimensis]MCF2945369.1 hypothetical protein [Paenibacillus tarimensis]